MQTAFEQKNPGIHKILVAIILILSLSLQSGKLDWGLVTDNNEQNGLKAFHIAESSLVGISYRMMNTGDFNPHFFNEPGMFYNSMGIVFALVSRITDIHSLRQYIFIARIMVILFTAGVVLLVYLTGKMIAGEKAGLFAALLMALNPYYLWFSSIAKEDPMMVFLVMLAMYLFTMYLSYGNNKYFYLSMVSAGFAASVKYPALLLFPFLLLLYFLNEKAAFNHKLNAAGKSFALYVLAFITGTPSSILATGELIKGAVGEFQHYTTFHPGFIHFSWFVHFQTITGMWDAANIWGKNGYGLILLPLLIGLFSIQSRIRKEPGKRLAWFMIAGWIFLCALVFGFIIKIKMGNQLMILTPAAMIVAGMGFENILNNINSKYLRWFSGAILIFLISTYAVSGIVSSQNDNRYYAAQWLDANVNPDARISTTFFVYLPDTFKNRNMLSTDLQGLEKSNIDYIILSSWEYDRFLDSPDTYPVEAGFYRALIDGNTSFKQVAVFERTEKSRQRTLNFGLYALTASNYRGEVDIRIFAREYHRHI